MAQRLGKPAKFRGVFRRIIFRHCFHFRSRLEIRHNLYLASAQLKRHWHMHCTINVWIKYCSYRAHADYFIALPLVEQE